MIIGIADQPIEDRLLEQPGKIRGRVGQVGS
jgi:hypothetical protein